MIVDALILNDILSNVTVVVPGCSSIMLVNVLMTFQDVGKHCGIGLGSTESIDLTGRH